MGWGYGRNQEDREIGYSVQAECDRRDCHEQIDRGLGYVCGGMHDGGDYGCGRYFCGNHLYSTASGRRTVQLCGMCLRSSGSGVLRKLKPENVTREPYSDPGLGLGIGSRDADGRRLTLELRAGGRNEG